MADLVESSSVFLYRETPGVHPEVLLHAHKKTGELLHPGGKKVAGEFDHQTAMRELEEETGFTEDQIEFMTPRWMLPKSIVVARALPTPFWTFELPEFRMIDSVFVARLRQDFAGQEPKGTNGESQRFGWYDETRLLHAPQQGENVPGNVYHAGLWVLKNTAQLVPISLSTESIRTCPTYMS